MKNVLKTRREKLFWWTVAIVGLLGVMLWAVLYFSEPRYEGRRVTDWLIAYHVSTYGDRPEEAAEAEKALRAIGTNAIPVLLRMLLPTDRSTPVARMMEMARIPMDSVEDGSTRATYHVIALNGFHRLGPAASNALPQLIPYLSDPERANYVSTAIGFIGTPAIAPLTECLVSTNSDVKRHAVRILFSIVGGDVESFSKLLKHPDPVVRGEASAHLVAAPIAREKREELLLKALNDADDYVVGRVAGGIPYLRTEATNFLPRLYELSKSTNAVVAGQAKSSIERIEDGVRSEKSNPRAHW